jgi:hypothetical protein
MRVQGRQHRRVPADRARPLRPGGGGFPLPGPLAAGGGISLPNGPNPMPYNMGTRDKPVPAPKT